MMLTRSILLCMGTRPEIIKMAPVYHELRARHMHPLVLHTGQHAELAAPMYAFFGIVPALNLNLSRDRQSLSHLSALMIDKVGYALEASRPRAVLVHGDTSSALMAALAAFYEKIPVGHVEAGLRSHDPYDPFPEETNRVLLARLARWHFAPTRQARRNLRAENIAKERVHMVGNTVVDAVSLANDISKSQEAEPSLAVPESLRSIPLGVAPQDKLVVVTAHRRENLGEPISSIAKAVAQLLVRQPDLTFVWPVHANPKVREPVSAMVESLPPSAAKRLFVTEPLDYGAMIWLLRRAWLVLTDSGGIQEEAASLHVPILVMRLTTERPELIESGGGLLVGTDQERLVTEVERLLLDPALCEKMSAAPNPFGDGFAAGRIATILKRDLDDAP